MDNDDAKERFRAAVSIYSGGSLWDKQAESQGIQGES